MKIREYDYEPIGLRIKQSRQVMKYTQEQLAECIGVATNHISEIERGVTGISIPTLMELCQALSVDADYILFGKSTVSENNPFNKLFENMLPEQVKYAEEIVRFYAKGCGCR